VAEYSNCVLEADSHCEEREPRRLGGAESKGDMRHQPNSDALDAGTPVSVEAAFRRVRLLVGALVLVRLWTAVSLPHVEALLLVGGFWSINLVSYVAERQDARTRVLLGVVQLLADTMVVLLVAWAAHEHGGAESADWAVLVLPAIEGAIRFQVPGAFASWLVLAGGYWGLNLATTPSLPAATVAQRLTVVLLVALPVGYLADQLVAEIDGHRRGRAQAEQRSVSLRAAALGGRRTSQLDVDEILDVIHDTVCELGFTEPEVFELGETGGEDLHILAARPVRGSARATAVLPGDERLRAAASARSTRLPTAWPIGDDSGAQGASLFALPVPLIDEGFVALTAVWPGPDEPPSASVESLELFAAQAGASLHNAHVHRGLEELKDRLDHEASHDPLTELANRRLFLDELERTAGRGRAGNLIGVLFIDLDGFKDVNDRYGHDAGNALLVGVANRLRECVRPGDLVARIGGDEFTIMLTRLQSEAPAAEIADRICRALAEPFEFASQPVRISSSVGVALAPAYRADTDDLMRRADSAMYRAKSHGKARWMIDPGSLEWVADADVPGRKNL
jgi:diguanylate cyclase (GGDEF)-like protein